MYTIKNGTMYVYELNNYDKPSKVFQIFNMGVVAIKNKEYNKNHVFKLLCGDDEERVFAAPEQAERDMWVTCIQEAIDDYKEKNARR